MRLPSNCLALLLLLLLLTLLYVIYVQDEPEEVAAPHFVYFSWCHVAYGREVEKVAVPQFSNVPVKEAFFINRQRFWGLPFCPRASRAVHFPLRR